MKMERAVALGVIAAVLMVTMATADDADWQAYKAKFKKNYKDPEEDNYRRLIRAEKLEMIKRHNAEAAAGGLAFTMAENHLTDATPAEYEKIRGFRPMKKATPSHRRRRQTLVFPGMPTYSNTVDVSTLPATVNWTAQTGWVGPVQDQGQCGSCWSYSAAGALQGQYFNQTQQSIMLSEQNLIDCSGPEGDLGCGGGNYELAWWYVQLNGIETLANYPDVSNITGVSNQSCMYNPTLNALTNSQSLSWRNIAEDSESALQQAVALTGPVSVSIDAQGEKFQLYSSGVYTYSLCSSNVDELDHAVLVVGYGVYNSQDYWLIKNSWGTDWGMNGYMMMARNDNNMCGIATAASFPVLG